MEAMKVVGTRGHTQRQLQQLLAGRGLAPRSSLGQCFLTDLNLLDILVHAAELTSSDFVLEVGAGTGSLTRRLAERSRAVISVEIDRGLYELASETLEQVSNVQLLHGDILQTKNSLNPAVFQAIASFVPEGVVNRCKVVANLPYVVATPVISLLLLDIRPWERLVVTVQKELADRLTARPGTKDYGSLSVLVQALGDVELLREVPPTAFWPRPKVWSAFVRIIPQPAKREAIVDLPTFSQFSRGVMLHRRKVLRSAIRGAYPHISKQEIDAYLQAIGIDSGTRAEELPPAEFVRLANGLPAAWRKS
jgi:16S rRNA (adenine1518-N6/adenine1519-N6)-dimethyltransferase